jgi:glycosyltransferase involved in cell wall biosynthesis
VTCPKLSVVIIGYNIARELPRTIRSFSPLMQRQIDPADYELILVDNGSTAPFDAEALLHSASNLRILEAPAPSPSPVDAINLGLEAARGDLVGVCIDGARMTSPGLLACALQAAQLHPRPVIGSLAFHLGPEVQMESVRKGYDQAREDALLAQSGWEADGYRLFDISVFAGSSSGGWFVLPAETNALFLRAAHWRELGGYDCRFQSPGGGLANLDVWRRACDDPSGELIMLLGEATFHQVHGGVATNAAASPWEAFHEEYVRLRGAPYAKSRRAPRFFGSFTPHALPSLRASVAALAEQPA